MSDAAETVRFLCHDFSAGHDRSWCLPARTIRTWPTQDTNEPYQWIPGGTYDNGAITYNLLAAPHPAAGLAAWVGDFLTTYDADNTVRATLTLDDGETPAVTPEALAGLVTAGEPVVSGNLRAIAPVTPEALAGLVTAGEPVRKRQPAGDRCISDPARTGDDGHRRG